MEKKYVLGISALAFIAILGAGIVAASGFGNGFMNRNLSDEDKAQIQEQRDAMRNAIESKDYDSWKSLMEEKIVKMQEQITQENFDEIVTMHENRNQERENRMQQGSRRGKQGRGFRK